jgi:hypothetical protein
MTTLNQQTAARLHAQDAQITDMTERIAALTGRITDLEQHIFTVAGRYVELQARPCPVCGKCAVDDDGDCLECIAMEEN